MSATDDFAAGALALAEALRTAATDPADQVRLLSNLANFTPNAGTGDAPIGQAMSTVAIAVGALCRRAALISLARACADYQPSSYDDAVTLRTNVCALLDAEITIAADNGDDQSYQAFRALRTAVAQDLNTRGASLPQLTTVTTNAPLPALALAYRLYQDATRADDLIARADPAHPAFMPTSFEALSN